WPPASFAEVADHLAERVEGQIVLLGDRADQAQCEAVAAHMRQPAIVAEPAPSLLVLAGGLARCRLVIGNDSGALHLAAAVGTPSIAIFGPASPVVYGPYPSAGSDDRHRVAVKSLACRPCYAQFRLPPCPWDHRCLTTLTPGEVYAAAEPLLAA
ncbi:MAG: glycosyltransferase family 9 protein, partial [Candidatus Omnitrophica bacterium]|nr:glycosyltransferase family 9 protein [Candidatus Omnitrophota bacterium]